MADKLRKTQPLSITFSEGEQPTAQKLSVAVAQSRNGSDIIERAIGDLWNESGDTITSDFPLQIPNLARLLGENKYLNPALVPVAYDFEFDEHIGSRFDGETTGHLNWRPKASSTPSQVDAGTQFSGTRRTVEYEVGDPNNGTPGPNEWFVSEDNGKFRIDSELLGTEILRYTVDPTDIEGAEEVLPGIIPDPRTPVNEFTSCRVSASSGKYFLHLPPRRPLSFTGTGYDGTQAQPGKYPTAAEIADTNNFATTTAAPYKYWQRFVSPATFALNHEHYRYRLPKEILDAHATLDNGAEYPAGFMYLWDSSTNEIISDVVFKKPSILYSSDKWIIEVESSSYDFGAVATATEAASNYNSTNLVLVTCGGPVARSLWQIIARQLRHTHDNTGDQIPVMSHNSLEDSNPPTYLYTDNGHNSRYPTYLPRWSPSRWEKDSHTSLLSRGGSQSTTARYRDPNNNAMLGDLILANSVADANNVFLDGTTPNNSFKLFFGDRDGPSIYSDTSGMRIDAPSGSHWTGLRAFGNGNGHGVYGERNDLVGGYGVYGKCVYTRGVYGEASLSGYGVYGSSSTGSGVHGVSTLGTGVTANGATGVSGTGTTGSGVTGNSTSGNGIFGSSTSNHSIYGTSNNGSYAAVYGTNNAGGYGVYGNGGSGGTGVFGFTSGSGTGVYGDSGSGNGVYGETSSGTSNAGVWGYNLGTGYGVYGRSQGGGAGVYGTTFNSSGTGVQAVATTGSGKGLVVSSASGNAIEATTTAGRVLNGSTGNNIGLYITNNSSGNPAAYLFNSGSGNGLQAGSSSGHGIQVTGNTQKAALYLPPAGPPAQSGNIPGQMWVDSVNKHLYVDTADFGYSFSLPRQHYSQEVPSTRTNITTVLQVFPSASAQFTANQWKVGDTIDVLVGCRITQWASAGNATFYLRTTANIGSSRLSGNNASAWIRMKFTCTALGSSGVATWAYITERDGNVDGYSSSIAQTAFSGMGTTGTISFVCGIDFPDTTATSEATLYVFDVRRSGVRDT